MNESRLFIQVYTDEDITPSISIALRQRGFAAESTLEAGNQGLDDEQQLLFAASKNMALITSNERDFVQFSRTWMLEGRSHGGIIIAEKFRRHQFGEFLHLTLRFLDAFSADEMQDMLVYLSAFRE